MKFDGGRRRRVIMLTHWIATSGGMRMISERLLRGAMLRFCVAPCPTGGFCSEGFALLAVERRADTLRQIVREAVEGFMPAEERERLQEAEQAERAELLARLGGDLDDQ